MGKLSFGPSKNKEKMEHIEMSPEIKVIEKTIEKVIEPQIIERIIEKVDEGRLEDIKKEILFLDERVKNLEEKPEPRVTQEMVIKETVVREIEHDCKASSLSLEVSLLKTELNLQLDKLDEVTAKSKHSEEQLKKALILLGILNISLLLFSFLG